MSYIKADSHCIKWRSFSLFLRQEREGREGENLEAKPYILHTLLCTELFSNAALVTCALVSALTIVGSPAYPKILYNTLNMCHIETIVLCRVMFYIVP